MLSGKNLKINKRQIKNKPKEQIYTGQQRYYVQQLLIKQSNLNL